MNGKLRLYVDQWGQTIYAHTVKELKEKAGFSRANRMYVDKKDGRAVHVGYVVGPHWFRAFTPFEGPA